MVELLASLSSRERSAREHRGKQSGVSGVLDAVGGLEGFII